MKIKNPKLIQVAGFESQFPKSHLKEVAFVGRSNVGKSSFINTIFNRKNLAKTSEKPGKTRTINFYNGDDKLIFVDLPGYGYARASKSDQEKWAKLINTYLHGRENLIEVFLLVDSRHKPSKEDQQMYEWIRAFGFSGYVILTKCDKLSKNKISKSIKLVGETLDVPGDMIIPFSKLDKGNVSIFMDILDDIIK